MKSYLGIRSGVLIALALGFLSVPDVMAQRASPLEVRKLDGDKIQTPEYSVRGPNTQSRNKDWFRVYAEYDTEPEWLDEATFTFYVVLKSSGNSDAPPYTLLKGEVTYVNIEEGRRHEADMFIHPSTLARYGDVERVAVLVNVGGRVVAMESKPSSKARWWEQLSPQTTLMLNRLQTPFAMLNFDNFEMIKPATR